MEEGPEDLEGPSALLATATATAMVDLEDAEAEDEVALEAMGAAEDVGASAEATTESRSTRLEALQRGVSSTPLNQPLLMPM